MYVSRLLSRFLSHILRCGLGCNLGRYKSIIEQVLQGNPELAVCHVQFCRQLPP